MSTNIYGHDIDLPDTGGSIVTDVVVICRTIRSDDPARDGMVLRTSNATGGIVTTGLLHRALANLDFENGEAWVEDA